MRSQKKIIHPKIKALLLLGLLLYIILHFFTGHKPPSTIPPTVIIKQAQWAEVGDYVTQTGNTVAFNSVDLVARVEGYLDTVEFVDGTFVKKNRELFVIEPQPYLEKLKAAQAKVVVQKALYAYTLAEYQRQKRMYRQNATSENNVEKWLAKAESTKAEIDKAVADEAIAAINYSYTHIHAPFDGRIGRHLVDPGNLVGNGAATDLATIEQIDPLYVYFNLNELDLIRIRAAALKRGFKDKDLQQIPVEVALQNESGFPHKGALNFVNTGLNASTGTMEFRALLPNKGYPLVPGLFVKVRIPVNPASKQLTLPDLAVQYDQIGPYLLTVDKNNIVVIKRVVLGSLEQGKRAILKGIDSQDRVVIRGLQNASPGSPVTPKQDDTL
jgi:multidrug efflux system membrane fusion protein